MKIVGTGSHIKNYSDDALYFISISSPKFPNIIYTIHTIQEINEENTERWWDINEHIDKKCKELNDKPIQHESSIDLDTWVYLNFGTYGNIQIECYPTSAKNHDASSVKARFNLVNSGFLDKSLVRERTERSYQDWVVPSNSHTFSS